VLPGLEENFRLTASGRKRTMEYQQMLESFDHEDEQSDS
jgi:hypothetical protein